VAWWSSSMLVTTATSRASFKKERSDSSASITAHSPAPQAAFVPAARSSPPIRNAGSRPVSSSARAIIEAVVVFPCVPPTAIVLFIRDSSARRSPRWRTVACAALAASSSGLSSGMALETTTSAPAGTFAASWPVAGSIPAARSRSEYGDSAWSDPVTVAPSSFATSASPLIPAPPMPMK
jgi:hypothetical protein